MQRELGVVKSEQLEDHVEDYCKNTHVCHAHRNPIDFEIPGGEVHDSQVAPQMLDTLQQADYFIVDKGYDSKSIRMHVSGAVWYLVFSYKRMGNG